MRGGEGNLKKGRRTLRREGEKGKVRDPFPDEKEEGERRYPKYYLAFKGNMLP